MLTKSILDGENVLLKNILREIRRVGRGRWNQLLDIYLRDVGLVFGDLETLTKSELWRKIRDLDNREWHSELGRLTDREVYKAFRKSVGGSWGYDNSIESDLLFQARSNTLKLNVWYRHTGGFTGCELCGAACEDLEHFLLDCPSLNWARDDGLLAGVRGMGTGIEKIGGLLFNKDKVRAVKAMLGKLWRFRCSRLGERRALLSRFSNAGGVVNVSSDSSGSHGAPVAQGITGVG